MSLSVERFEWQQGAERKRLAAHDEMEAYRQRVEANGGRLEPVDGHEGVVGGTPCYFAGSAVYDKRGPNDESGMLYLTERGFLFVGESRIDVPWSKVVSVEREGDTTLLIQRRDRQTPTMFVLDSLAETLRAEFIAATLR